MFDINHVNCTLDTESNSLINAGNSFFDHDFTKEQIQGYIEKSNSYSFNQSHKPLFYKIGAKFSSSNNIVIKIVYNIMNDTFQVVQIFSFDFISRDEWYNPFTGSRFGNLDGTPNYNSTPGVLNTLVMGITSAAGSVGNIPKGAFFIQSIQAKGSAVTEIMVKALNTGVNFVNGQISKGMGVLKVKTLAPKNDDETENK